MTSKRIRHKPTPPFDRLETKSVALTAWGLSPKEISHVLVKTENEIKEELYKARRKYDCKTIAQLMYRVGGNNINIDDIQALNTVFNIFNREMDLGKELADRER